MTITLPPEAEPKLRDMAERVGQNPDVLAGRLILNSLAQMEQEFAEDVAAIHEAMEDVRAGRERPYEEFMAEQRKRYPNLTVS